MKFKAIYFLVIIMVFASCDDDNVNLSSIADSASNGAVIELVSTTNNTISQEDAQGSLEARLEYRDDENGTLLEEMRVYLTYYDLSEMSGDSTESLVEQEILFETIGASNFIAGENSFPVYDLAITADQFLSNTNNTSASIAAGDIFTTRFELLLTDGRVFTSTNTAVNGGLNIDFIINTEVN
ncbi:hypothetical protein MED134_12286 [Dokdonia sp. MED134]|uniref:hypothetical protein n=1 Tax=Dokdonia sp. MED134 TaxID=313590 RepID=UPI000068DBF6|nr:hypothetical protein [Dokdonia sp. MED134]EAQ38676.1 hypothetical protein MED134_12286 [Dokdonia sp. MED134]